MKLHNILKTTATATLFAATSMTAFAAAVTEPFQSTLTLIEPLTVTEVNSLRFPEQEAGTAQALPVLPTEAGAAQFNITGEPQRGIVVNIVETSIEMITDGGGSTAKSITVDSFDFDGVNPIDGSGTLDVNGNLNNVRVGGTAHIEAEDVSGDYVGTATFRVIYS